MEPKLHPVIKHLLERRGKTVPVDDGRKITLVLFGGFMGGVRGAGVVVALEELGLAGAFDSIYTMSAGFANACYLLSKRTHQGISIYLDDMCQKQFLDLKRIWKIVDMEFLMNALTHTKPFDHEAVSGSATSLYAHLHDLNTKTSRFVLVNGRPAAEIDEIMLAATRVPYLLPGAIVVDGQPSKDGGMEPDIKSAIEEVLASPATDIVIAYNFHQQEELVRREFGIFDPERVYEIIPYREESLAHACQDPQILKRSALEMGEITKSLFGEDGGIDI